MTPQTTATLTERWRLPSTLKPSAFVQLRLSTRHWMAWLWALPRARLTTHRPRLRPAPCTRTTAPRVPMVAEVAVVAGAEHSLDDRSSKSPFSSPRRHLHKRNSAAQSWRTTRNAPTGEISILLINYEELVWFMRRARINPFALDEDKLW